MHTFLRTLILPYRTLRSVFNILDRLLKAVAPAHRHVPWHMTALMRVNLGRLNFERAQRVSDVVQQLGMDKGACVTSVT